MQVETLLRVVLAVEVTVAAASMFVVLFHGAYVRWRTARTTRRMAAARDAIVGLVAGGEMGDAERTLRELSPRRRVRVIAEVAAYLAGEIRARLVHLAGKVGVAERVERRCRSPFWWRRLEGGRLATLVGAGDRHMPTLLADRNRWVRAQAAAWAATEPGHAHVDRLLALLDDEDLFVRTMAQDALLQVGEGAIEPLARRLASGGGAAPVSALQVAVGMSQPAFRDPALGLSRDLDPGTRRWSAQLLGRVGGETVVARLEELVDDPDPAVRATAVEGLGRLGHWPAAAPIAARLRDPSWDVRRASAQALRAFGAPGRLFLERGLESDDRFAADMARQALDVPGPPEEVSR